jgi:hypothetical protein
MIALFILMIFVAIVFVVVLFGTVMVVLAPIGVIAHLATHKSSKVKSQQPLRAPSEKEWRQQQAKEQKRWGALAMLTVKGKR